MENTQDLLLRIQRMEEHYDRLTRVLGALEEALDGYDAALPDLRQLREYMDSGQWQRDYASDEAGEIPSGLKRGVLSQDGLYDLLQEADRLRDRCAGPEAERIPE